MYRRGWITTIKDSSGDRNYFANLCQRGVELGLKVFQGRKPDIQWLVELGAAGIVPVPANLDPRLFADAWNAACGPDSSVLASLQLRIDLLWDSLVKDTDFISRSTFALAELGIGNGHVMTPFTSTPGIEHDRICRVIADMNS